MPEAHMTDLSAVLERPSLTRHASIMHLVREQRTSPFSTPMTFANPSRQGYGTLLRPANAYAHP